MIRAIKKALDEAGIDMPYETTVVLLHDQTEAGEGDRSQQREGWPAAKVGATEPRWKRIEEQRAGMRTSNASRGDSAGADDDEDAVQRISARPR